MTSKLVTVLCAAAFLAFADSVHGAAPDPAAVPVQTLTSALPAVHASRSRCNDDRAIPAARAGDRTGFRPSPRVTRLAVGPEWTNFSPGGSAEGIDRGIHARFTVANYAHSFPHFLTDSNSKLTTT